VAGQHIQVGTAEVSALGARLRLLALEIGRVAASADPLLMEGEASVGHSDLATALHEFRSRWNRALAMTGLHVDATGLAAGKGAAAYDQAEIGVARELWARAGDPAGEAHPLGL
jgi:hypothetical protein